MKKVLIAADYEANYLTIAGVPIHVAPEIVAAAQQEAQELVRALVCEVVVEERMNDLGPDGPGADPPADAEPARVVVDGVVVPDTSRVLAEGEMDDGTVPGYRCAPDGPLTERGA